jgi:cell division protein FtsN
VRGELAPRGAGVGGLGGDSGECPTKREDKCRASLFSLCSTAWAAGVLYVFVTGVCLAAYSSHKRSPLVARSRTALTTTPPPPIESWRLKHSLTKDQIVIA